MGVGSWVNGEGQKDLTRILQKALNTFLFVILSGAKNLLHLNLKKEILQSLRFFRMTALHIILELVPAKKIFQSISFCNILDHIPKNK